MSTALYDLAGAYAKLIEVEEEEGRDLSEVLAELRGDIQEKAENICRVIRSLEAEAGACTDESDRLRIRAASRLNRAKDLKCYLQDNLEQAGIDRVKGQLFTVSLQASPPSCQVLDEAAIPEDYKRIVTTVSIDKTRIIQEWRNNREVPGALVTRGKHLRIY